MNRGEDIDWNSASLQIAIKARRNKKMTEASPQSSNRLDSNLKTPTSPSSTEKKNNNFEDAECFA